MSQKENNIFQLARIIAASLRGKANDEEQRTLREWLSVSTRNKKIYDGFKDGKRLEQKIVESQQINWKNDYQHFITKRQRARKNRRMKTIIRYAAILTLPIVAAGIFLLQKNDRQTIVSISEVIKPGEHKAVLITGGGERITLSDSTLSPIQEQNGMIVNVMNNKVSYTLPKDSLCTQESPIFNTLQIPRGGEYFLTLADGTEVWLNAESRLKYPSRFTGEQRVVELEGEGYFKVTPDSKRPFIVKSGDITTEVLGTEFNVRTYVSNDSHVTLLKGSVKVKNVSSSSEVVIRPGEDAHLQGDGTFDVREVDTDNYYLWTEGYFYFDNETVVEIMRELGRWYNIRVEFENPQAMNYRLHFLAERDQKIEEVLQLLNMLGKVQATYENNKISVK